MLSHLLWFSYLLLILALMVYDMAEYLKSQWGRQGEILHLVSYFTFLFQVLVIPLSCFVARLRALSPHLHVASLPTINCWTVFRRALFLQSSTCTVLSSLKFALFVSWPVANGIMRVSYNYWNRFTNETLTNHDLIHEEVSQWAAVIGYLQYGTFCYLIYILRSSLQWELSAVVHFVSDRSPTANLDVCRDRIGTAYADFRVLRDLVGLWMAFTMAVATWGITAHFTWNYAIFSRCHLTPKGMSHVMFLNLLIWSQKVMFFVLPYIAVGGLNLQYIWQHLRYNLTRVQRAAQDNNFWNPILRFTKDICFSGLTLKPTILFSAIGLFLGLKIRSTNQNVEFWNGPYDTNMNWGHCYNITISVA